MRSLLDRVGAASAAHPWRVIGAWSAVLLVVIGLAAVLGGAPRDNYDVPGLEAQVGTDLLRESFPEMGGANARVLVHSDDGPITTDELSALTSSLDAVPHVVAVGSPRVSDDGDTALISLSYDVPVTDFEGNEAIDALRSATAATEQAGLQIELGGEVPENASAISGVAEMIGIAIALVILLFVFGSVVAAGLPLLVALVGVGVGSGLIMLLSAVIEVSIFAPDVATMVGVGVGIDYALLLVTRFAEGLRNEMPVVRAAGMANATAGVSVIFAGTTVLISLFGLRIAGMPVYSSFGYATFLMVAAVMLASITLVPAVCGLAGHRVLGRKVLPFGTRNRRTAREPFTARWARRVSARPWPYAIGALLLLLLLAAPVLQMRTWPQDAGSEPTSNTVRLAYDLTSAEFGAGANGPFLVAVDLDKIPAARLPDLTSAIAADPGVTAVSPAMLNPAGTAAVIEVQPTTGPQDEATTVTLDRLRATLPADAHITGLTPTLADMSDRLAARLWLAIAVVVAAAVLLLTAVFRPPVVALKAAAMNLLSVAATYGVLVAIFQWGWGATLIGLPHAVPVSSWVPLLIFTILFGLSMDYEVFLLSRVREQWLATGDTTEAVARGLSATGRVITGAGAIMIAVFLGYAMDPNVTVKTIGVGLAVAVLLDVTVVRMMLVPASMALLGKWNWWIPGWLDRALPRLDIDAPTPEPQSALVKV